MEDMMNAGQDDKLIEVHARAMDHINQALIELQDETVNRMSDALESAEATAAELRAQLDRVTAERDAAQSEIDTLRKELDKHEPIEWPGLTGFKP